MTGGYGPSCDRGDGGGDGSNGSSSGLLRPAQLPSPLAFASEPERGAGGGIDGGGGGGCSFGVVMGATRKSVYHQKRYHGSIFFDPLPPSIIHGRSFFTHGNVLLSDPQEPSHTQNASWELFLIFNF